MRYYQTPSWKFKTKIKRSLQPYCAKCGATKYLQTHHLTYKRFKNEASEDLEVLCKDCHKKIHGKVGK